MLDFGFGRDIKVTQRGPKEWVELETRLMSMARNIQEKKIHANPEDVSTEKDVTKVRPCRLKWKELKRSQRKNPLNIAKPSPGFPPTTKGRVK